MLIIGHNRCKPGFFGELCESECKCGNSLDENVCDRKTGKCDLCKWLSAELGVNPEVWS